MIHREGQRKKEIQNLGIFSWASLEEPSEQESRLGVAGEKTVGMIATWILDRIPSYFIG